jgi:hypothetical protein
MQVEKTLFSENTHYHCDSQNRLFFPSGSGCDLSLVVPKITEPGKSLNSRERYGGSRKVDILSVRDWSALYNEIADRVEKYVF